MILELDIIHGNPQKCSHPLSAIDGYKGHLIRVRKVLLTLQIKCSLPQEHEVFIFLIPESISSTDVLRGQNLQTSIGDFHVQVRVIKPVLKGNANWEPVNLLMVTVKQYNFLRRGSTVK